jgi:hypothetical protein
MNAANYPVSFDINRPQTMSRAHVILRIALLVLVSWFAGSGEGVGPLNEPQPQLTAA